MAIFLESKPSTFPAIYGQGFFVSWLLTATATALSRLTRESLPVSRIEIAGFIATLVYPLIAAYDTYLLGSLWDTLTGNHFRGQPFDPQYFVTVSVCHWAIVVTFILTASDSSKWIRLIWPVVCCLCAILIMSGPNAFYLSLFELTANLAVFTLAGICGNTIAYLQGKDPHDDLVLLQLISIFSWLGGISVHWFGGESGSSAPIRASELPKSCSPGLLLAYPQTSARITDIPQLLPLAIALTVFTISSTPRIKRSEERRVGKECA